MKITRLGRGYRIRLSDSEFSALSELNSLGVAYIEGMGEQEQQETERDIGRGLKTITGPRSWAIDSDRREA